MRQFTLTVLLFCLSFGIQAQEPDREKIKTLKIAFLTERLNLTKKEAQEFWPVYNTFEESNNQLRHEAFTKRRNANLESLTESEAKALLNEIAAIEDQRHQLKTKFLKDLREILSAKKILLLKQSEDDFKHQMFEEFKKRRREQHGKP
ncbi:hypothetical protein [Mangrovimonas sp. DI 80]|uniref:hypothetical protein n=1 Tax=Mangrovimonas sp. DI 80 TaxID=1779330 RepID=UPI0009761FE8|nr:hypothetical protein [Mangrovimonas sp. DI 80]OMP31237.1 hypothetical protein BKM32_09275 [Mangrovimonas sp. DI 80]